MRYYLWGSWIICKIILRWYFGLWYNSERNRKTGWVSPLRNESLLYFAVIIHEKKKFKPSNWKLKCSKLTYTSWKPINIFKISILITAKAALKINWKWWKSFEFFPGGFYFCICIHFVNELSEYPNVILEPGPAVISYTLWNSTSSSEIKLSERHTLWQKIMLSKSITITIN